MPPDPPNIGCGPPLLLPPVIMVTVCAHPCTKHILYLFDQTPWLLFSMYKAYTVSLRSDAMATIFHVQSIYCISSIRRYSYYFPCTKHILYLFDQTPWLLFSMYKAYTVSLRSDATATIFHVQSIYCISSIRRYSYYFPCTKHILYLFDQTLQLLFSMYKAYTVSLRSDATATIFHVQSIYCISSIRRYSYYFPCTKHILYLFDQTLQLLFSMYKAYTVSLRSDATATIFHVQSIYCISSIRLHGYYFFAARFCAATI